MNKTNGKLALIICGPIVSGKTTITEKISDSTGDYLKTDPTKQRDKILSDVYNIKPQFSKRNHKLTIININHYSDYLLI